jgi:hypothetical protein
MVAYKHCNAHGYGCVTLNPITYFLMGTVNQHPPVHHPLDARYYSVVDEPQLS